MTGKIKSIKNISKTLITRKTAPYLTGSSLLLSPDIFLNVPLTNNKQQQQMKGESCIETPRCSISVEPSTA